MFSPVSVTFEILFCLFRTWWLTRFTNDLDSTDNSNSASSFPMTNCWSHVFSWESISSRSDLSRNASSVPNGLRGSVEKNFLVRETKSNFSYHSPRSFIKSPRSLVCLNISFPLLRRPNAVVIPLWVACWREAFHKLFMVIVIRSFQSVYTDVKSPWSLLFLRNCTPGILICITSLHRAYWSRRWYVRRRPCNKIHHWSRFCCDSFFSWIVLRSFRHCIRAHTVELKWLISNKQNKWFHSSRVKFPLVKMSANWFLVSMYLIWIFRSKLIRSNNQSSATLWVLETCLIVGLLPSMIILITCFIVLKKLSTKLLDAKTGRLREHNRYYSARWSFLEIFDFCQW